MTSNTGHIAVCQHYEIQIIPRLEAMLRIRIIVLTVLVIFGIPAESSIYAEPSPVFYGGEDPFRLLRQAEELYQKDPGSALDLIEEALLMAIRQNNLNAQGASYELLGDINFQLRQYDLAAANYQRALGLFQRTENISRQLTLHRLAGMSYEKSGDLDKALESYRDYVNLAENSARKSKPSSREPSYDFQSKSKSYKDNSLNELEQVRLAISEILIRQNKFEESVDELDDVAQSADTVLNPEKSLIINNLMGEAFEAQEMETEAAEYYSKNASTARKLNKPAEEAKATSKLADIYGNQEMSDEALELRNRSIEIYSITNDSSGLAQQYLARGKLQKRINQPAEAEESFKLALDYSKRSGDKEVERETYNEYSDLEEKRGRIEKALEYYKKYVALQDDAFRKRQSELEDALALNSSLLQQQQRIDLLEKNEEISNKTIEVLRANETIAEKSAANQRLLIYGLLLIILLLSISGYLMYKNMRRKRVANQLLALKSLRSQMNPHFIFNALNSVNHYISQQDERAANKYLTDFSRLMRSVLENSKEDFITLATEVEIIRLYLQLEHNRFSEKFDYELSIDENLDLEHGQIPPMLVQPYIENAIWHGLRYKDGKGTLKVIYKLDNNVLVITVEDDGIGRARSQALKTENQKKNQSTGMTNIENRLEIINSMYGSAIKAEVIDLPDDSGTRIILRLPVLKPEVAV
jgi:tetratricopeptide (TPR) repeat protein